MKATLKAALIVGLAALTLPAMAADTSFMSQAAQGGVGEVTLGKLAAERGSSADVKGFGRRMVTDHSKANAKLMAVASKEHVVLPKTMAPEDGPLKAKLSQLSGKTFDHAYIRAMVEDHKKDVADFEKEARSGKDPRAKAFAAQTLPTLKMHLQMARRIAAKQGK